METDDDGAGRPARGRAVALVGVAGAVAVGAPVAAARWCGTDSRRFALVAAWAPMTALGTLSKVAPLQLPEAVHRLRRFERDGARAYEWAGVRVVKAALRRGPIAAFNPRLHLPGDPTPARVAELDRHMRVAEATHTIAFVVTAGGAGVARACGRRTTARWMLGWNVVLNGYPVLLQRYNRALLARRFGTP